MSDAFLVRADWDSRQLKAALAALAPKQWAFATALALTRVAQAVKAEEQAELRRTLDRPTPFTLGSLRLERATKDHQSALVWFKDPPRLTERDHYLLPQVYGGGRVQKRFERTLQRAGFLTRGRALVPASGAPVDAFGNVKRGFYAQLYAQLKASPIGANESARSRARAGRRRRRTRGGRFFYGNPGGRGAGIWERFAFAFGSAVRPVFLETRPTSYRERFAFFAIAERVASQRYEEAFAQAAEQTLRTVR